MAQQQQPFAARGEELPVDSGLVREDRKTLAVKLGDALASTYMLYHKTHAYHWNVTGPMFYSIHKLTDEQYQDLAEAVDGIAERIRAVGFAAPAGFTTYSERSVVKDVSGIPTAGEMLQELADDHQRVAAALREIVEEAEKLEDVYTADLLTARIGVHEEAAWMLNAMLVKDDRGGLAAK